MTIEDQLYKYKLLLYRLYDGDSIKDATIDLGFFHRWENRDIRLAGIDTPEIRHKNEKHKEAGKLVTENINMVMTPATVWIQSHEDDTGKYGTIVANVYADDLMINQDLLNKRFAKMYFGGKKPKWTDDELQYIIDELAYLRR